MTCSASMPAGSRRRAPTRPAGLRKRQAPTQAGRQDLRTETQGRKWRRRPTHHHHLPSAARTRPAAVGAHGNRSPTEPETTAAMSVLAPARQGGRKWKSRWRWRRPRWGQGQSDRWSRRPVGTPSVPIWRSTGRSPHRPPPRRCQKKGKGKRCYCFF